MEGVDLQEGENEAIEKAKTLKGIHEAQSHRRDAPELGDAICKAFLFQFENETPSDGWGTQMHVQAESYEELMTDYDWGGPASRAALAARQTEEL